MTPNEHLQAAEDLLGAEASGEQIGLLTKRHPEMEMEDAYAVQNAVYRAKLERGRSVVGWKIGLTSKRFIQPRIEAEIAFVMKSPIGGSGVTRDDVLKATDYVAPSIEILDTRIVRLDSETGRTRTVFDTISDNAANAGVVIGPARHAVDAFDLRWVGAITLRNTEVEETGLGAGVLNDPVESVVWLARRMAQYGQSIEPGQIILSGSFIRPVECPAGAQIVADFGAFGYVDINFD